ncbi:alcohol dehydrogenase catalytic domain-containing protein [Nocardia brasiliensis]|uniref:Alcohol dehydrogenase catalytic domain-containing protein n=1 Tax=Nocardia brasiliensis TaxID=37326 RepID=A0A6G9XXG0_NOCBR|nr:alcohol dehydrogenase catalytic domain-containing protein [Nocardia brasiliensis]QIS05604.1 alcohol dehydrogenase catalytic domain-containing protein [Nocardia brasiliensis]
MQALVFESPMKPVLRRLDVPEPAAGEALVKIAYNSICGSDLSLFKGVWHGFKYPIVPGHEWSGEVVATAAGVAADLIGRKVVGDLTCACGQCAACGRGEDVLCQNLQELGFSRDGACAEYMTIPAANLHVLPADLDLRTACQVEPMAVALHAMEAIALAAGERVAVLGAGGIGLLLMTAALSRGADVTVVSDPIPERRAVAAGCGARVVAAAGVGELARLIEGQEDLRPDVVFEASGYPSAVQEAIEIVRPGGRVCLVGYRTDEAGMSEPHMITVKALTLRGVLGPGGRFADAISVLGRGDVNIEPLLTHEFGLADYETALQLALSRGSGNIRSFFHVA